MKFDATIDDPPASWTNNRLHFFKYASESTAKIVLRNRTLRWSTASVLNDPFELRLNVSIEHIDIAKVKERALENMWLLYSGSKPVPYANGIGRALEMLRSSSPGIDELSFREAFGAGIDDSFAVMKDRSDFHQDLINSQFATVKILSLTTEPDNELMWAHYGNSARGVVLRFRSVVHLDSPYGVAKPVIYSDVRPNFYTEEYLIGSMSGTATFDVRELNDRATYTKGSRWAYEREWRVNSGDGRTRNAQFEDLPFGAEELDGIVFGWLTSTADRDEITNLAAGYPYVELFQARPHHRSGTIEIVPL